MSDDQRALQRASTRPSPARGDEGAATGLLVVMAAVFVAARAFEPRYPGWLVKAFAEAAMVGGLADWFAVTACSATRSACRSRTPRSSRATRTASARRWPIPQGEFPDRLRWSRGGCAHRRRRRGRPLPPDAAGEGTRIRARRLAADRRHFRKPRRRAARRHRQGRDLVAPRKMEVSPLLGHALASAINEDRHVPMLEAAIRWTARALDANESLIREMVHKRANWVLKLAGLDAKLADAIIDGLRKLTVDMSTDPAHPVRVKVEEALAQLANDLQTKPETRERVEAMKDECSTTARSACGSTPCGRRAARRSSAPRATPTRRWPASSARC
jgi:hypothetical protein